MELTATPAATATATAADPVTDTSAIDDLDWDDWTPAQICSIENGPDCEACEG